MDKRFGINPKRELTCCFNRPHMSVSRQPNHVRCQILATVFYLVRETGDLTPSASRTVTHVPLDSGLPMLCFTMVDAVSEVMRILDGWVVALLPKIDGPEGNIREGGGCSMCV